MVTLGLSVGQGATRAETKVKWIELGNYYEVGNGRCALLHSRQYCYDRYGKVIAASPSLSLARLMISMLSEQLRSCHFLKKGMETKTKEMR